MLMMICLKDANEEYIYCDVSEYREICETLNYVGVEHIDYIVEDKMYRITWFDDIDEEWKDIWSTEEDYEGWMEEITKAEVEYSVREFN